MYKRIIPCLDIRGGRVVKGKKFQNVQDVADPITLAKTYEKDGADELFILDITGEDRPTFLSIISQIREAISIPITVGGGIRRLSDAKETIEAGANKVAVTSAAITHPHLLTDMKDAFTSECVVLSIDAGQVSDGKWHAYTQGGKHDTGLDVINWAQEGVRLGAGEILLNSIDTDGVKSGFNLPLNEAVANAVPVPVIASGGAGELQHFASILSGKVAAALAASVFHYGDIHINVLKNYLKNNDIPIKEYEDD